MKKFTIDIPDKIFGIDSPNIIAFVPLIIIVIMIFVSINIVFIPKIDEIVAMQSNLTDVQAQTQKYLIKPDIYNQLIRLNYKKMQTFYRAH